VIGKLSRMLGKALLLWRFGDAHQGTGGLEEAVVDERPILTLEIGLTSAPGQKGTRDAHNQQAHHSYEQKVPSQHPIIG
jgi:hypothetical protein